MDFGEILYALPLWLLFILTVAICVVAVESGSYLAKIVILRHGSDPEAPLGSLVASLLGLLAFILAFTFGMTASRFESRKQLLLDEANALSTAYLRAGLLPAAHKREVRSLLSQYLKLRLSTPLEEIPNLIRQSDQLHELLWAQAEALVKSDMDSELRSLFIASLNNVIDLHESRLTVGLRYHIPGAIWLALLMLTILSMLAIGYQVGMSGRRRLFGMPLMTLGFSLVIVMIATMDNPGDGKFHVSHQPLDDAYQMMQRRAP